MLSFHYECSAALERNHELIRYILPKGTSFEGLTQEKIELMFSHINSIPRRSIGGLTPFSLMRQAFGEAVLDKLGISEIKTDDLLLKPCLLDK